MKSLVLLVIELLRDLLCEWTRFANREPRASHGIRPERRSRRARSVSLVTNLDLPAT